MRKYVLVGVLCLILGVWFTATGDGVGPLWVFNAGTCFHFARQEGK